MAQKLTETIESQLTDDVNKMDLFNVYCYYDGNVSHKVVDRDRLYVFNVQESKTDQTSQSYKINGFEREVIGRTTNTRRQRNVVGEPTLLRHQIATAPSSSRIPKKTIKRGGVTGLGISSRTPSSLEGSNEFEPVELNESDDDDNWQLSEDELDRESGRSSDSSDDGEDESEEVEGEVFTYKVGQHGVGADSDYIPEEEKDEDESDRDGISDYDSKEYHSQFSQKSGVNDRGILELAVGMTFNCVQQYRTHLKNYAIQEGFEIYRQKNERTRVNVVCANDGCPWRIHASLANDGKTFIVRTYADKHTCSGRKTKLAAVNSRWIAAKLGPHIRADPNMPIKSMAAMIKVQYGLQPSKQQLYRARTIAKEEIEGNHARSFAQLPTYLDLIDEYNPGAVLKIQMEDRLDMNQNPMFKRMFVWFKTFAFGIVEAERKDNWMWFLDCLSIALQIETDFIPHLTFMSDKQKGLIDSIQQQFPRCNQRHCCRHLYANFRGVYPGAMLRTAFWTAAKASTVADFQKAMGELKAINVEAHEWLMRNPPANWSRHAFDHGAKSDHVTNNMAESFNQWIAPYRDKPIVNLIDQIRVQLMTRFHQRYANGCTFMGTITPAIKKRLLAIVCMSLKSMMDIKWLW
ncbi:uncharacterized protein LOC122646191 [Telopea speciosissima]|uniref:uncharacterized protein LOC122646191 n=1 Tax=Telopea speciosissima TaxID=54955 RepID=UPI001CC70054|nr:uncharacterized protein LOC122646191 [Telopea speciosissima]